MENTYRDVNIALANEFSRVAVDQQIDVWEAIQLANFHPRVNILKPGPGVGGHCISVDPWFLVEVSPIAAELIRTARKVNDSQPEFLLKTLKNAAGDLNGRKIAVLGLAYKPDIDDLRESPAVEFAQLLVAEGADLRTFEPYSVDFKVSENSRVASNLEDALHGAEIIILLVGHSIFREYYAEALFRATGLESRGDFLILDAVNILQSDDGFRVVRLGDGR